MHKCTHKYYGIVFGDILWEYHGVCEYGINSVLLNCICEFAPASFFALFQ